MILKRNKCTQIKITLYHTLMLLKQRYIYSFSVYFSLILCSPHSIPVHLKTVSWSSCTARMPNLASSSDPSYTAASSTCLLSHETVRRASTPEKHSVVVVWSPTSAYAGVPRPGVVGRPSMSPAALSRRQPSIRYIGHCLWPPPSSSAAAARAGGD